MKKIAYILAVLIAGGCFTGCSDTVNENTGIGRLMLNAEISPEIQVSRAIINGEEAERLSNECLIWISNSKGLVREYKGIRSVPAEGIWLTGGQYVAEAWSGDSVPASFTERYFKGIQKFEIKSGNVDRVSLPCVIANVGVSISYEESVDKVLKDFTLTVGHSAGSLTWTGKNENRGYFMMNSRDKDLTYLLKGINEYGEEYTQEGMLKKVKPGTEYKLRISHQGIDTNTG
ncbi:MAG: DUF4493 domain-containing protein, partial [Muribaculaceae bacterium]|nr:DUF4493 domain-containing protein [Muribaculaceae bacterium]